MTSRTVSQLLCDLGVLQSHSRPHVSNDNPYSEAQFKTLKYSPTFPKRFANIAAARSFCDRFSSTTTMSTATRASDSTPRPTSIRTGRGGPREAPEHLDAAYVAMPGRFRKPPQAPQIPEVFWINRPEEAPSPSDVSEQSVSHIC